MNSSNPKVPLWALIATDTAFIAGAWWIGSNAKQPWSNEVVFSIVGCLTLGALTLFVPLILRIERQKNETLDERQRALEALARTVAASAEQISIAASGLHQIADLTQKNLKHAEQLPHKLQEKIAEFQSQLANSNDAEKDELEKELAELRSADSERLQSVSDKIARSTAEWVKLEAATQQHLAAAGEAIAKLSRGTADAIGKAQAAAEQALAHARVEAAKSVGESSAAAAKAIEAAKLTALSELAGRIDTSLGRFDEKLLRLESATAKLGSNGHAVDSGSAKAAAPSPADTDKRIAPEAAHALARPDHPAPAAAESATSPAAAPAEDPASARTEPPAAPKRPRKPRREETSSSAASTEQRATAPADEPAPVSSDKIPEIAPIAPSTAEPFAGHIAENTPPSAPAPAPASVAAEPVAAGSDPSPATATAEAPKSARKRPARKPEPEPESEPSLGLDDSPTPTAAGVVERVLSSDGATRLLVTAYIGIGNRLFIRGEGGGLTWEKGVPLQFVSIGKWRWETNDAANPVRFKLFKNDEVECTALGAQSLEPGHQQEVMAAF